MISFIWSEPTPLYSGRGGSENYTIGQVRELTKRGIDAQIVSIGHGKNDGRQYFPDIHFIDLEKIEDVAELDGTVIYVFTPHPIQTKNPSYAILHCPPTVKTPHSREYLREAAKYSTLFVNSDYTRHAWAKHLSIDPDKMAIVPPFADAAFAAVKRSAKRSKVARVLYAGRLHVEKGIYTLHEALHHAILQTGYSITVTNAGNQTEDGKMLENFIRHHPKITMTYARHSPCDLAELFAEHDIVAMPSNHFYWHEAFGMLSVEAQHAGCRVVASNDAGLPETDCGNLILFEPGNSYALAQAIQKAAEAGPVPEAQRQRAIQRFTRSQSVDMLLKLIQ